MLLLIEKATIGTQTDEEIKPVKNDDTQKKNEEILEATTTSNFKEPLTAELTPTSTIAAKPLANTITTSSTK